MMQREWYVRALCIAFASSLSGCSLPWSDVITRGTVVDVRAEGVLAYVRSTDTLQPGQSVMLEKIVLQPSIDRYKAPWRLWRPVGMARIVSVNSDHAVLIDPAPAALAFDDDIRLTSGN